MITFQKFEKKIFSLFFLSQDFTSISDAKTNQHELFLSSDISFLEMHEGRPSLAPEVCQGFPVTICYGRRQVITEDTQKNFIFY